ncbi:hypothetical protein, partial [Bacteroides sp.]|uniref:phage tail protein n=1 Tax=Bacteroides sp. TaxID=29523 RepID=UPI00262B9047
DFAQKNPEVIKTVAKIAAGLVGLKAGGLIAKLGFLQVKGGILPLVGVIAAVGGAIYMVSTHLDEVRGFIQKTFGDEGLAVFDKLWGIITQVGTAIKDAFFTSGSGVLDTLKGVLPTIINTLQTGLLPLLPMIANLFMQIIPLIGQLVTAILPVLGQLISVVITVLASLIAEILPVIVQLISAILPLILQIIQSVLPIFIQLVNTIVPILTQIIQAVLPVIIQLIQTLLPIIMQIIETVLPVVINLLNTLLPIFSTIIQAILPPLSALLTALIPVITLVAEIFANVLGSALQSIAAIVTNVMGIFQGLIDFITGVFTGNWSQAWEGVKSIFSGIFGGLGEIFKAPFRAIVSVINTVIQGLNKLKVPDWVPGIGGMGINIPQIPGFAKGTNSTPNTFVAGEEGPELITNAPNRKVFTAAQTGQIFNNMSKAQNLNSANGVNAKLGGAGTITLQVTNSPTVVMQGGDTNGIKAQLAQYDEGLAVFDKLWGIITQVGTAIKDAFFTSGSGVLDTLKGVLPTIINTLQTGLLPLLPMIANLFMQIIPLIGQLVTAILPVLGQLISVVITVLASLIAEILPVIVQLISAILPLILQIIQSVLPIFIQLVNTIVPILTQIIQAVLPVIIQLIQTLLPIIMQIIETVLPVVINLLNTLLPIFSTIIQAILPPLSALLTALIPVITLVAEIFANVLGSALQSIAAIVTNVMGIFQGLIDFITGVFTGNWSQAWEGVKSIFSGIFGGLGEIFKAPFRAIVSVINTVIQGLNKLKVPDWVPGIGGMGINIPQIPGFAKGTNSTPNTFVAGEEGPELITNAPNRKVFTAAQTGQIFNNMSKAQNLNSANGVNAKLGGAGTITLQVTNSPTVVMQGGDTNGIKAQLAQYDEEFLEKIRTIIVQILKEQKEQEGRVAYA